MRRLIIGLAIGMLVAEVIGGSGQAEIVLPNLPVGSQYQLIFVTVGTRDATSPYISVYNSFVTTEAALNPVLPNTIWHAVASTTGGVAANINAPSGGYPVYNTQGILVAPADTGLYRQSLLSPILYDQFGIPYDPSPQSRASVWTGTDWRGEVGSGSKQLGSDSGAIVGSAKSLPFGFSWAQESQQDTDTQNPLYALSEPITVVPEPSTFINGFLLGALGLLAVIR